MGAFPLPALHVNPPADPMEQMQRALSVRSLIQKQQADQQELLVGQQNLEKGQFELDDARQQQEDQQEFRRAQAESPTSTLGQLLPKLVGRISPKTYLALQAADQKHQAELSTKTKTDLDNLDNQHKLLQQAYNYAMEIPDEKFAETWSSIARYVNSIPGAQIQLDPSKPMSKQDLQSFGPILGMNDAYLKAENEKRKGAADSSKAETEAQKSALEVKALGETGGMTPAQQEGKYRTILMKQQRGEKLSPDDVAFANGYAQSETRSGGSTSTDDFGIQTHTSTSSGPPGVGRGRGMAAGGGAPRSPQATPVPGAGGATTTGSNLTPMAQSLVDEIGTGRIALNRLDYILARKPALLAEVALRYPGFDSSKAAGYPAAVRDFTSGRTKEALNAGGTALKHLQELRALNTYESRVPGTDAYARYQNKAQTVSTELARFYAGGNQPNIPDVKGIADTLNSTVFPRDAAIQTQAQSMGDKLDEYQQTWDNAAPSDAYKRPMPNISQEAKAARASLDPNYAARTKGAAAAHAGGKKLRYNPQTGQLEPQ